MRRIALVLIVLALPLSVACRKEPVQVDAEARNAVPTSPAARLPLSEHCGNAPCRTYAESVTAMKQRATSGGMCLDARLSACGAVRDVEFSDGYSRWEEWFDASGKMVGAKIWEDYRPEGGDYGAAMPCKLEVTERLCPPPAVLDASAG